VSKTKTITGFPGYEVSDTGRVWSHKTNRWLQPATNRSGYLVVSLRCDGKAWSHLVHRLVAAEWIPNPHNLPEVNHMDGTKTHNHARNLEWVTHQQNMEHAHATGLLDHLVEMAVDCFSAKTGKKLRRFSSMHDAERASRGKCKQGCITSVVSGKRLTAGGYQWRLSDKFDQLPPLTAAQINHSRHTSANYHVRNTTTGEEFLTYAEVRKAGYNPVIVSHVLAGRQRTHANCTWERVSHD